MAQRTITIRDAAEDFTPRRAIFEYHAKNGQVFVKGAWWYEAQETMDELSALAYENDTSLDFLVVH